MKLYRYRWGNNEKRIMMKGRLCRILCRSTRMGSVGIEFVDNGQQECVSWRSITEVANRESRQLEMGFTDAGLKGVECDKIE
jgi:hypothetical protein